LEKDGALALTLTLSLRERGSGKTQA
jgi:hypothetical protein